MKDIIITLIAWCVSVLFTAIIAYAFLMFLPIWDCGYQLYNPSCYGWGFLN